MSVLVMYHSLLQVIMTGNLGKNYFASCLSVLFCSLLLRENRKSSKTDKKHWTLTSGGKILGKEFC